MRGICRVSVLIVLLSPVWSCEKAPEPVAKVTARPSTLQLPYPGYTDLELEWDMRAPLDGIQGEPLVFV